MRVRILLGRNVRPVVELNGIDYAAEVESFRVMVDAFGNRTLVIGMPLRPGRGDTEIDGDMEVRLADEQTKLLTSLGWRAPTKEERRAL